jgi:hypothetical protein
LQDAPVPIEATAVEALDQIVVYVKINGERP